MPDVALISELTWRSLKMQREAFPDMQHFIAPDEIPTMLRPTRRKDAINIHVMSLGVIADNQADFIAFMESLPKNTTVISKEEGSHVGNGTPIKKAIVVWASARRFGAAKAGGKAKAQKDERIFWEGFNKIADRWHLPAKGENASPILLKEADTSRNTAKSYLGYTREEWQKLTQAKRERILERNSWKGNRDENL